MTEAEAIAELNKVGEVKRLDLKPEEVLVIESAKRLSVDEWDRITAAMREVFPNNKIVVMDVGLSLSKVVEV